MGNFLLNAHPGPIFNTATWGPESAARDSPWAPTRTSEDPAIPRGSPLIRDFGGAASSPNGSPMFSPIKDQYGWGLKPGEPMVGDSKDAI